MMDDFSLARPAGHLIMGDGSGPDGLAKKDGAKALSGAESVDTATTQVDKPSTTINLIIECEVRGERHADPEKSPSPCDKILSQGEREQADSR
jgi:hypothetical protein